MTPLRITLALVALAALGMTLNLPGLHVTASTGALISALVMDHRFDKETAS